jgi:transcriptional regulator with XRE-family HTH domain
MKNQTFTDVLRVRLQSLLDADPSLTRADLARELGVVYNTVARFLRGDSPSGMMVDKVVSLLGGSAGAVQFGREAGAPEEPYDFVADDLAFDAHREAATFASKGRD